jgi:predicted PurR-regulated permease PerM
LSEIRNGTVLFWRHRAISRRVTHLVLDQSTRMKSEATWKLGSKRIATGNGKPTVVRVELSLQSLLIVLAVIAGFWLLLNLVPVVLGLVAAIMIVGALSPFVAWLERRKMKRISAVCLVFGVGTVLTLALATVTVPTLFAQTKTLAESEPRIRESVAGFLERSKLTSSLADDLRNVRYADVVKSFSTTLIMLSTRLAEIAAYGLAAVFLAFYIMIDRDRLRGALFAVVPRRHHISLSAILLNLGTIVGGYIRGQLLTCLFMSGFILVLLLACRVPNALVIAVFGGVMDLLPYVGIFLTMAPAVLAAAVKGPVIAAIVFAFLFAYEELESRVLVPLVYGRALRLPSSVVFFSLIVGTTLAGIAGALLALPIAAAVLMLVEELRVELPGETIQPEDIEQRRKDDHTKQEYERRAENLPAEQAAAVAAEISGDRKKAEVAAQKAAAEADAKAAPAAK